MDIHHEHPRQPGTDNFDWSHAYRGELSDYEAPDPDLLKIGDGLRPGRALDVGCGAGGLVLALAERGWQVTGVDITEGAIASARKVLDAREASAELIVADATSWAPAGEYDLITSGFAVPDGPGRAAVFRMMSEALAPGGVVALKEFDSTMTRHGFFAAFDLVTLEELRAAFAGLEITRLEIVDTPVHEHAGDGAGSDPAWTAALLHARKP